MGVAVLLQSGERRRQPSRAGAGLEKRDGGEVQPHFEEGAGGNRAFAGQPIVDGDGNETVFGKIGGEAGPGKLRAGPDGETAAVDQHHHRARRWALPIGEIEVSEPPKPPRTPPALGVG